MATIGDGIVRLQETLQNNIECRYRRTTRDERVSRQWCACQQAVVCESAGRDVRVSKQWGASQRPKMCESAAEMCESAGRDEQVNG